MEQSHKTPLLFEEVPSLRFLYPFEAERNWPLGGQVELVASTLPHAIALCVVYVLLIFGGQWYMRDRKPFDLRVPLALWNLGLAVFSFIGSLRVVPFLLNHIYRRGLYHASCGHPLDNYGHGPIGLWATLFVFSKIPELVDTLFIVARKKPLIFLHWYHHITVLLFCWHGYATLSASGLFFVAMNYTVHAVMYFYYFLTACGYRPRWALGVTVLQLSQMAVGVTVCGLDLYYLNKGYKCSIDTDNLKWAVIMYSSYFALFLKFFLERYCFSKRSSNASKQKKVE